VAEVKSQSDLQEGEAASLAMLACLWSETCAGMLGAVVSAFTAVLNKSGYMSHGVQLVISATDRALLPALCRHQERATYWDDQLTRRGSFASSRTSSWSSSVRFSGFGAGGVRSSE
jgi:hypothetical protein